MLIQKAHPSVKESHPTVDILTEKIEKLHQYSGVMLRILTNFRLSFLKQQSTVKQYIQEFCALLEDSQIIEEKELVVEALLEREKSGGIGIPEQNLRYIILVTNMFKNLRSLFTSSNTLFG